MNSKEIPPAKDACRNDQTPWVTNRSTTSRIWRVRMALGVMELALCVLVPAVGLLLWTQCDTELRTGLSAGFEKDRLQSVNAVYDMISTGHDTALAIYTQGQVKFWDISQSMCVGEIQCHLTEVHCAAYSDRQRLLAVGSIMGQLEIWDLDQPDKPIATSAVNAENGLEACEFTPDGSLLCSAGELGEVVLWEPKTLRPLHTLRNPDGETSIRCLEFTRDGRSLLTGNKRGTVHVWNTKTRSLIRTLQVAGTTDSSKIEIPDTMIEALMILPGNRECVVVTRKWGISVWDLSTGTCLRRWAEDSPAFHSGILSAGGKRLLTGNELGEIWTWEIATGRRTKSVAAHAHPVRTLAINRDGTFVMSGDWQGEIRCRPN